MGSIPIHLYFELISFLASITLYFQKGTPRYMKTFPVFLLLTVIVEIVGWQLPRQRQTRIWVYNFYVIISFDYYLWILKNFIVKPKAKKLIFYSLWGYPILALIDIFFIQLNEFHSFTFALGCLLVVSACIYYYLELFRRPQSIDLIREQAFWITCGLLFFHCCTFAFFSLMNSLFKSSNILPTLNAILKVILFFFYTLFTIGFLCRIRKPVVSKSRV
jgi:hypothetical protein